MVKNMCFFLRSHRFKSKHFMAIMPGLQRTSSSQIQIQTFYGHNARVAKDLEFPVDEDWIVEATNLSLIGEKWSKKWTISF
jgi:hypothetical protein